MTVIVFSLVFVGVGDFLLLDIDPLDLNMSAGTLKRAVVGADVDVHLGAKILTVGTLFPRSSSRVRVPFPAGLGLTAPTSTV